MTILTTLLLFASTQEVTYPTRPGDRDFIVDEAGLLKPEDAAEIKRLAGEALTKKKAPIVVCTIPSLKEKGAGGWPLQRYAMNLMSEWKVGWSDWNYGMLILVSKEDRKARVELGGGWGHTKDAQAQTLMNELMVPNFRRGDFSKGLLEGVRGLHSLALGLPPVRGTVRDRATEQSGGFLWIILAVVAIAVVGSMMMRGGGGGGGGMLGGFGAGCLGAMIGNMLFGSLFNNNAWGSDSGGGGDWGGGSFGDGFSGGGGADGSW